MLYSNGVNFAKGMSDGFFRYFELFFYDFH